MILFFSTVNIFVKNVMQVRLHNALANSSVQKYFGVFWGLGLGGIGRQGSV